MLNKLCKHSGKKMVETKWMRK